MLCADLVSAQYLEHAASHRKHGPAADGRVQENGAANYSTHFSEAEIDDRLRFYSSPSGKKTLAKLPFISTEGMEMGREWGTST